MSFSESREEFRSLDSLDLENLPRFGVWPSDNLDVTGFADDSNRIEVGHIFFGLSGFGKHGCNFVGDAIDRGASIVITDEKGKNIIKGIDSRIPLLLAKNPRHILAKYSARWYEKQPKKIIAVTGTNGKTSVCHFVRQIWSKLDLKSASIGTLGVRGDLEMDLKHTTPDPILLHKILRKLSDQNIDHVVMEASSHGLDQYRLDAVDINGAAFTNLSRDHLDYHITEEDYLIAKSALFDRVMKQNKFVVTNVDDSYGDYISLISRARGHRVLTVGKVDFADFRIEEQRFDSEGQYLKFSYLGISRTIYLRLIGAFQATNVLIASALVIGMGIPENKVFKAIESLESVPGRMELVTMKKPDGRIFVDYAHTPAALQNALLALRPHTAGKLILVFGAGGERDRGKRGIMGQVASKFADTTFVTDDNPRKEIASNIRSEILKTCPKGFEIADRASAIMTAIESISVGDVLLIAGKGHETVQIIGDDVFPFNDSEFASMSVAILEGKHI
ncbi:MAG: UDP-N-acetylmuramoyl-L-alanyl-D-glutamate--2,6-diaminopimelate ligase [Pseudomonadota bacterium]|nr:UDP-N-acetylmuramoyl-L-alanyl-D-glutamate--2,6-diaminopimelate ligase [Pseudomonadota bacterium]